MAKKKTETIVIEAEATATPKATETAQTPETAGVADASGGKGLTTVLPLILSAVALAVGLLALILSLRTTSTPGLAEDESLKLASVDGIEMRVKSLETQGISGGVDLSGVRADIRSLKADFEALEGDLAATIDAVNAEFRRLQASLSIGVGSSSSGSSGSSGSSVGGSLADTGALAQINERLSGLTATVEGSLTQLGALSSRISTAEDLLQGLPEQIIELRTASGSRFDGLQSAVDEGMNAVTRLSTETETALTEAQAEVAARLDEMTAGLGDDMSALGTRLDAVQAEAAERLASLNEAFTTLTDEFTALKEVSVETSTKVLAVNQLQDALASSAPVRPHLTSLEALNPTEEPLLQSLETIAATADLRVPTGTMLAEAIRDLSPTFVTETRINTAEGTGGKVLARLGSLVKVERIEDIDTIPGIEGNMARAVARIEDGDFDAALTELTDETVTLALGDETQARYDRLVSDMRHRATYEDQRRILGDWVTTTLNAARATTAAN